MEFKEFTLNNFNQLKDNLSGNMHGIINTDNDIVMCQQMTNLEVKMQTVKQIMADDLVDALEERINLNILYAIRSSDGSEYQIVGFGSPTQNEMYIAYIESSQHGIVEDISFKFFESIEYFFSILKEALLKLELKEEKGCSTVILEKMTRENFWNHFFNK